MELEVTDEHLAILVLLEDKIGRNVTEIVELFAKAYKKSKLSSLKASRATFSKRILHLHYTEHLALIKDRSGTKLYEITPKGLKLIAESEKNEFTSQAIANFRNLFKATQSV